MAILMTVIFGLIAVLALVAVIAGNLATAAQAQAVVESQHSVQMGQAAQLVNPFVMGVCIGGVLMLAFVAAILIWRGRQGSGKRKAAVDGQALAMRPTPQVMGPYGVYYGYPWPYVQQAPPQMGWTAWSPEQQAPMRWPDGVNGEWRRPDVVDGEWRR